MTTRDYTANVISATKVVPDGNFITSKASGVWDINEALDLIKGGNWPNAANFPPDAFVDALFQTHLYTGNSSTRTITNGIDLSGKGGLVWIKDRDSGSNAHLLYDTERGAYKALKSSSNAANQTRSTGLTGFTSSGFTLGSLGAENGSSNDKVSWTFRKQPKFFDVVTYSSNQSSSQTINHNLGSVPGMIMVKRTSASANWAVYHRGSNGGTNPEEYALNLNTSGAPNQGTSFWNDTAPTSTQFTVGNNALTNDSDPADYVAYLFAHNNNDGGFGEPGDQDIIKCGSYSGSSGDINVNLGFEPQWLLIKEATGSNNQAWHIVDTMRAFEAPPFHDNGSQWLEANTDNAETGDGQYQRVAVTSTGFFLTGNNYGWGRNGETYIYMAIRRGGMQTPTAASDVFSTQLQNAGGSYTKTTGFVADMILQASRDTVLVKRPYDRLRGGSKYLETSSTSAEASGGTMEFDNNTGYTGVTSLNTVDWIWKRARGYFDIVAYTGNGATSNSVAHNLGVVPEMMWIRRRDAVEAWQVPVLITSSGYRNMRLDTTYEGQAISSYTDYTGLKSQPTSTNFVLGQNSQTNVSDGTFIAYLFVTAAGVSKFGSFTQSGATNVDCGFTGDTPSFIIIKRTDAAGDWYIFDSERGIVAGNDPYLELNSTDAEVTNTDIVDPYSGGFATTSSLTNGDYIFYAIAATS